MGKRSLSFISPAESGGRPRPEKHHISLFQIAFSHETICHYFPPFGCLYLLFFLLPHRYGDEFQGVKLAVWPRAYPAIPFLFVGTSCAIRKILLGR
jgi:hypothetical protein